MYYDILYNRGGTYRKELEFYEMYSRCNLHCVYLEKQTEEAVYIVTGHFVLCLLSSGAILYSTSCQKAYGP